MRTIAFLVTPLLFAACVTSNSGEADGGCSATSDAPFSTYTHLAVSCHECDLAAFVSAAVPAGAVNCGHHSAHVAPMPDAGMPVSECVAAQLDAGTQFVAWEHRGLDSVVTEVFFRGEDGLLRMWWTDVGGGSAPKCVAAIGASLCGAISFNNSGLQCDVETYEGVRCEEQSTRQVVDAGQRPLAELKCRYGTYFCSTDGGSMGTTPSSDQELTCTDNVYGGVYCEGSEPQCPTQLLVTDQVDAG